MKNLFLPFFLGILLSLNANCAYLLVPMDASQTNHLKAYGITYWGLTKDVPVDWLLNYRGGSFLIPQSPLIQNECMIRNVSFEVISDAQVNQLFEEIASPSSNMDVMKLEQYPKIAVYSPKSKQPWDDAVTLVLSYAEIPYEVIFDDEIMYNELIRYDWLHLHHEDFTGQYGRFYKNYKHMPWYQQQQNEFEAGSFSDTTTLDGKAVFTVGSMDTDDNAFNGQVLAEYMYQLNLNTSFNGDDNLYVRLKSGNADSWSDTKNVYNGYVSAAKGNSDFLKVDKIWYTTPVGDRNTIWIGPQIENYYMHATTPSIYKPCLLYTSPSPRDS